MTTLTLETKVIWDMSDQGSQNRLTMRECLLSLKNVRAVNWAQTGKGTCVMKRCRHVVLGVALVLAIASSRAGAQTPAGMALTQWGLTGTWAILCQLPASAENNHLSYTVDAVGKAFYVRQFGTGSDRSEIESARVLADRTIELVVKFTEPTHVRRYVFARADDGQAIRTMVSQEVGGEYLVRDGRYVPKGTTTIWIKRC